MGRRGIRVASPLAEGVPARLRAPDEQAIVALGARRSRSPLIILCTETRKSLSAAAGWKDAQSLRSSRTPRQETKVCPVCDATIDADARNCPSCLTDLSLFDVAGESPDESSDLRATESKSIDDILASIMDGKSEQPEIFETLKNVAGSHESTKDLIVEAKPMAVPSPPPHEEPEEQFLCPVCDTPVKPDEKVCPGCGAEFSEGEATEYECPMCKAAVPADADRCPSCGVRFASDEETVTSPAVPEGASAAESRPPSSRAPPASVAAAASPAARIAALKDQIRTETHDLPFGDRKLIARELPRLVNEVKPLLVSAKTIGVGIEDGKRLINGAIEAGKRKEMEKAVKLISDARRSLEFALVTFIGGRLERFAAELGAAGSGDAARLARPPLNEAFDRLGDRDYEGAWAALGKARVTFQSQAKEYTEGRKILEATERLMGEVRSLGMNAKDVDRLILQSRAAAQQRDLPGSLRYAKQAQDRLLQAVPDFVQSEMREARDTLLDLKMRGGDLSKPVGILKEASGHVKNEEWSEAIRFLKEFQKEVSRTAKA